MYAIACMCAYMCVLLHMCMHIIHIYEKFMVMVCIYVYMIVRHTHLLAQKCQKSFDGGVDIYFPARGGSGGPKRPKVQIWTVAD